MNLSDKNFALRKQNGFSQEELAEKMNVSRQAVSRWEVGSAQPDGSNILQLSKLFGVTADYLLNDDYESEYDVPVIKNTATIASKKLKKAVALCISLFGTLGNFSIYLLSRFTEVMVPHIKYENGKKGITGIPGSQRSTIDILFRSITLSFLRSCFGRCSSAAWRIFLSTARME